MDTPESLLFEALGLTKITWKEAMKISAVLSEMPEAQLEMAEWVAERPNASKQELLDEAVRLMKETQKS